MADRGESWSGNWCKQKLLEHDKVESIEMVSQNCLSVIHTEIGQVHIVTMSIDRIDADDIDSVLNGVKADFVLNVKKDPYIAQSALEKAANENFAIGGLGDAMRALAQNNLRSYVNPEIAFVGQGLEQHARVSHIARLDNRRFEIHRNDLPVVTILTLNDYELTAASVREAISGFPEFDAILKSNPNGEISPHSYTAAESAGVKLLKWGELLGALNTQRL